MSSDLFISPVSKDAEHMVGFSFSLGSKCFLSKKQVGVGTVFCLGQIELRD